MKTKKTYLFLLVIGIILLTVSCVKDLDFGQLEEVSLTPVFEADFIYSTFDISHYIPEDLPPDTEFMISESLIDTVNYDFVGTDFAIDNLERVELTIEVRNTIERNFAIEFQFLNEGDQPLGQLYSVPIQAGFGEGTAPVVSFSVPDPIVLDNAVLNQLADAKKIVVEIITPVLNTDLRGVVDIRSKASYFVNYQL